MLFLQLFVFFHFTLMNRFPLLLLFSIFVSITANSQTNKGICGTSGGEWDETLTQRLLHNLHQLEESPVEFRNTAYVPIRFNLVANSSGFGRATQAQVLDALCRLNQDFEGVGLQFYIKSINENINNTAIYTTQYSAGTAMNLLRDNAAMNIWVVDAAAGSPPSPNDPPGTTLGYYSPSRDWIVIRRDQANFNAVTLAHEVGHFFSLRHTHNGWDSQPWTPAIGNPAPNSSPGGVPTERQDGSNCATAGDFICDTPPDYNGLGFNGCDYNIAQDPSGVLINPDEQLFMSYFLNCVRNDYYFSPTQENIMVTDYNQADRNYLRQGPTPNITEITGAPSLVSPVNNVVVPGFNSVTFNWSAVTGADSYLLEIDQSSNFSNTPVRLVVTNANSRTVNTLEANKTYFWRVRPYNAYSTCAPFTSAGQFRTNSMVVSVDEIEGLNTWKLVPNPANAAASVQMELHSDRQVEGSLQIFHASGALVQDLGRVYFPAGPSFMELATQNLNPGLYFVVLRDNHGQSVRRLVISQ